MIINQIIHKKVKTYPTKLTENQGKVIENIVNSKRMIYLNDLTISSLPLVWKPVQYQIIDAR